MTDDVLSLLLQAAKLRAKALTDTLDMIEEEVRKLKGEPAQQGVQGDPEPGLLESTPGSTPIPIFIHGGGPEVLGVVKSYDPTTLDDGDEVFPAPVAPEPQPPIELSPEAAQEMARVMAQPGRASQIDFTADSGDIRKLPPGTTVRFKPSEQPHVRRRLENGEKLSDIPAMDRDLIRLEGDPDVPTPLIGKQARAALNQEDFDITTLPADIQPIYEGWKPLRVTLQTPEDVAAYEASCGDADIMAALEEQNPEECPEDSDEEVFHVKRPKGSTLRVKTAKGTLGFQRPGS